MPADIVRRRIDQRTPAGLLSDTLMLGSINIARRRLGTPAALLAVFAFALSAVPVAVGMPRGEKHELHRQIDALETAWRNALLKPNIAALDGLLADDYIAITPNGTLQTKDQTLSSLRSGRVRFTLITIYDRKVRFYGATALVNSVADVHGSGPEGDISGHFRYTRVYVRDGHGFWKMVSFEASRIREGGGGR